GGDQEAAHPGPGHHLGLAELGARHAERSRRDLSFRDLGTAMRLGVRPQALAGAARVLGHAREVLLEAVEVEQEGGRGDLVTEGRGGHGPMINSWSMSGRPFLQIPGPTLVPDRIVRAMAQPIIDHRGPRFEALVRDCLDGLKTIFQTERGHVVLYPGSGTGAWEATIVNTLSPGDRVLACVNGHFASGFARTAAAFGAECERLDLPYGAGVSADAVEGRLVADPGHEIRAVLVVHNETSTGVTSDVAAI